MHLAASSGDASVVKELLAAKADKSKQDSLGRTPEALAKAFGKADALAALVVCFFTLKALLLCFSFILYLLFSNMQGAGASVEHDLEFLTAYAGNRNAPEPPVRDNVPAHIKPAQSTA